MSETKVEVRTYLVNRTCSKCNEGTLMYVGGSSSTFYPKNEYVCGLCGNKEWHTKGYPSLEYEIITPPSKEVVTIVS